MYWDRDAWDDSYEELIVTKEELEEEEENDVSAMYFDVPLPYRPLQLNQKPIRRNI